jgi:hypothetical protein
MLQKGWIHLTSGRFLEVKNVKKQENLLRNVKPNERGSFRKSPESIENIFRSS